MKNDLNKIYNKEQHEIDPSEDVLEKVYLEGVNIGLNPYKQSRKDDYEGG